MKLHLPILVLLSLLTSCHKDTTPAVQLPPLTETGAQMMACKENGVVWQTMGGPSYGPFGSGDGVFFTPFTDYLYMRGGGDSKGIAFQFDFKDSVGSYPLITQLPLFGVTFYDNGKSYSTDATHGGTINVLYWNGLIISGTFSFDAIDSSGNVVHITDGEFDIRG